MNFLDKIKQAIQGMQMNFGSGVNAVKKDIQRMPVVQNVQNIQKAWQAPQTQQFVQRNVVKPIQQAPLRLNQISNDIGKEYNKTIYNLGTQRATGNETFSGNLGNMISSYIPKREDLSMTNLAKNIPYVANPYSLILNRLKNDPVGKFKNSADLLKNIFYGEPEEYKRRLTVKNEAKKIMDKYPIVSINKSFGRHITHDEYLSMMTPEEQQIMKENQELVMEQYLSATWIASNPIKVGKLKIDANMARQILGIEKGAIDIEINAAWRNISKGQMPRTIKDLAKQSKTTASKIVNSARDFLINEYKQVVDKIPKTQLPAGKVEPLVGLKTTQEVPVAQPTAVAPVSGFNPKVSEEFTIKIKPIVDKYGLSEYNIEDYNSFKTALSTDKTTGYAIKPDGDLISVFNVGEKGNGKYAVIDAIENGATKLDCFDGKLAQYYKGFGFEETGRIKWDDQYAPDNWDYATKGRPDIVYMQLNPKKYGQFKQIWEQTQTAINDGGTRQSKPVFERNFRSDRPGDIGVGTEPTTTRITPQPEGLKTPIGEISTIELQKRIESKSKFKDAYQAELTRRGLFPPKEGVKESGLIKSIRENEANRPNIRRAVSGTYDTTTDAGRLAYGKEYFAKNPIEAEQRLLSSEILSNELEGIYYAVDEHLQLKADALDRAGNQAEAHALDMKAVAIDNAMAERVSPHAQAFQFLHLFSKKSPENMARWAKRIYDQSNKTINLSPTRFINKITGKKYQLELTEEKIASIKKRMAAIRRIKNEDERAKETKKLMRDIVKNVPPSILQYTEAYRYQNMLINPLTQLRNIFFNTANTFMLRPATIVATGINDTIGRRVFKTTGEAKISDGLKYYQGLTGGMKKGVSEFFNALSGDAPISHKIMDTSVRFSSYNSATARNLPAGLTMAGRLMNAADLFFTEFIGKGEYAILTSRGMEEKKAEQIAYETAAQYLYRKQFDPTNKSGQGYLLSSIDSFTEGVILNARSQLGGIPGWFVPFVRVPMSIGKMNLEYNPFIGGFTMFGNSKKSEQLAKMEIGAVVFTVGAILAATGNTTWSVPTDPEAKQIFYDSGRKPFSFSVGDNSILSFLTKAPGTYRDKQGKIWIPMMYAGPLAMALVLPAAYKWYYDENRTALTDSQSQKLFNVATSVLSYWADTTPVAGLGGFLRVASGDVDYSTATQLGFTAGQAVPFNGLLVFVAGLLDPIYRKTDSKDFISGFTTQIQKGLPLLSKKLEAYKNSAGEVSQKNLSNFILPYGLGISDSRFENLYQLRGTQLQQNAISNKINKEKKVEEDKISLKLDPRTTEQKIASEEDKVKLGILDTSIRLNKTSGNVGNVYKFWNTSTNQEQTIDLNKVLQPEEGIGKIKQQNNVYKTARDIWNSDLPQEQKIEAFKTLNVNPLDVRYDALASYTKDEKTLDFITKADGKEHEWILERLRTGRQISLSDKMYITDAVLKDIYDEGLISESEYLAIKRITYDKNGNQILAAGSGGGKISLKAFPKYPTVTSGTKIKLGSNFKTTPIKIQQANILKAKMPKLSEYVSGINKMKIAKPRPMATRLSQLGQI